jgi:PAS domain S-box-containing protein
MPKAKRQAADTRLARLLDGLVDGFLTLDGQGRVTFMNKAARAMLAPEGDDPTGRHFSAFTAAIPGLEEQARLAADGGAAVQFDAFSARLAAWLEVVVSPAEDGLTATFRKIGERKLTEDRLKMIFTNNPHGMALLSWPEAAFAEVNEAWQRATGYSRAEALGKTGLELGLWDETLRDELRRALAADGCIRERVVPVRVKGGGTLLALLSVDFIELLGRRFLVASSLDISERARAEELAKEQLGLLEDFSGAEAGVATLIVDEAGSIVRFFGERSMFAADLEGASMHTVLPPPVAAELVAAMAAMLAANAPRTTECRLGEDEAARTVRVTGAPMTRRYRGKRTVSFRIQDITAEKAACRGDDSLCQVAFQLLKDKNMQRVVRDTIGSLAAHDRRRDNKLVATLERIIEDDNLRIVAEKLCIRHNTAIQRKKRIEQLLGLSLDSFETKAMVSLYLKIWRLSGQDES